MLVERANFIRRLEALRSTCNEQLLVNTQDALHNERAKQLRCGITVMVFSALEEFIKSRVENSLQKLLPAAAPFGYLPEKLRLAATLDALRALYFQQQYIAEDQKITFLANEFKILATAAEPSYRISKYSFVHSGSNVQLKEITSLLEALHVDKPWETVYQITRRLKLATANPSKADFERLSKDRHAAAHKQSFDIPNIDLSNRIESALSLGVALDVVITAAIHNLNSCMAKYGRLEILKGGAIEIYSVSTLPQRGKFRLEKEGRAKAIFTDVTLQSVKANGLAQLNASEGVVVVHDGSYKPKEWYCEST